MVRINDIVNICFPIVDSNNFLFYIKGSIFNISYIGTFMSSYFNFCKIFSVFSYYYSRPKKFKSNVILKPRSFINKSNKKVRRQKGIGKARMGSYKSPLVKGGSAAFI